MKAFGSAVPILRIFDDVEARAFYLDYLGFSVEWEHRFEPDLPLYIRISRGECILDLSQHYGDGTPGSSVWIPIADVVSFNAELLHKKNPRSRPGIDRDAPGGPTMTVIDPFSNNLRFCQVDR
ncbi:glyoxalase/bleomycin resistance/extradiol dioxygenase family protein [Rhodococcus sp. 15-649-2-2]|uniref:glyoxalase superfamily protein n=1 Tax=Rhodococcus sp. 15-649-2-2 TaxID=2023140 RepID=UPI000B9A260E|nr:glyoxalase superfamily protein [Rhodococcus sp. 15-649-2-2]OZE82706.1 glyoxalase/bleomycin resistance/extradiol dioxygenase family protein [Rhodococcus sp. 15-649-2-2]